MRKLRRQVLGLAIVLVVSSLSPGSDESAKPVGARENVLVELYTSQGDQASRAASNLLGKLGALG